TLPRCQGCPGRRVHGGMTRLLTVLIATALLLPALAAAQPPGTNAPPGNSAIDEYLETIPSAGGNSSPGPPGQPGARPSPRARALERLGPDGRTLAALVDATPAASAHHPAGDAAAQAKGAAPTPLAGADARSPFVATLSAAVGRDDGQGLGPLLP